jgi:aminopeptidase N
MKKLFLSFFFLTFAIFAQSTNIHHELNVKIIPQQSFIEVVDDVTVNSRILGDRFSFTLNEAFNVELLTEGLNVELTKKSFPAKDIGMDRDDAKSEIKLLLNEFTISGIDKNNDLNFQLKYFGTINSPIEQSEENYQRGFSESPGIISALGVYLAGSTYWIPTVEDQMVSFNLTTELPSIWRTVSQGERIRDDVLDETHVDTWKSLTPQEEVFLIAAKFNEYKYAAGAVDAFAFLRTPDEALANKYLETTAQYLEMYRQLVGPYPYTKFALVENFWETGYGMPSFTLLGEKIIRFPFILHSSYPHELLHNWWGNSVYVNFETGNWCEGLTAYMADHLIKEQRGQAEEYRRTTLQKFTDYVNEQNDFPLNKFLSRFDGASEAIGYGKSLMFFHMLRMKFGDDVFKKAFQTFNRGYKFKNASFDDIKKIFEEETRENLSWFFDQWISRTGAPTLNLTDVKVEKVGNKFELNFRVEQIQKEDPFIIDLPVAIIDSKTTHRKVFLISKRSEKIALTLDNEPLKILVDPQFDVFRRLDTREIPPAFTKAYGDEKSIIILPNESDKNIAQYKQFADGWIKGKEDQFEIVREEEISELPSYSTVWLLGKDNKFLSEINKSLENYNSAFGIDSISLNGKSFATINNSFFVAVNHPQNIEYAVLALVIENDNAVPGLLRKLPHYGKYSYLAFEGEEPTNIEKGQWAVIGSPLVNALNQNAVGVEPSFKNREALANLAPVFSSKRMMEHINYLASDEMNGRELGSPELDQAADFIAAKFKEYGLLHGSDKDSYFQTFEKAFHGKGNLTVKNVIGIIPGTNEKLEEAVVISAHYDHLGLGWPDVRKGNEGKIHNGADDNASGVSVMLELAQSLGKSFKPSRTIIFAAFSGEEAGLVGSKYFVENYKKYPSNKIFANLNFDTVGRLFENKLMVLNSNTAREWKFIFMGTEYTTGIPTELITQDLDASDQVSFINKGIPAIQFFSGPNEDYHKPEDTVEKIDPEGLVKVAAVAKEVIQYLANREEAMPFTGTIGEGGKSLSGNEASNQGRKVSTGMMPDFAYSGDGVKVGAVSDDSPGSNAGLMKSDIIKKLDGTEITSLKQYSDLLKTHKPGDEITLEIERDGEVKYLKLILAER